MSNARNLSKFKPSSSGLVETADIADDAVSTDQIANNAVINTSGAITTTGAFTSVGIDDNADATTMTIDTSERIGVGTTTMNRQVVLNNNSLACLQLTNSTTGVAAGAGSQFQQSGNNGYIGNYSGSFTLFTGASGNAAQVIDANGYVTKPLQPVLSLYGDTVRVQAGGQNSDTDVSFTERIDNTNSYDTANKYFDVPVDGKYLVNFYASVKSNTSYVLIKIKVGSTTEALSYGEEPNDGLDWVARSCQTILDLSAGDAVRFQLTGGSSTASNIQILENKYRGVHMFLLA